MPAYTMNQPAWRKFPLKPEMIDQKPKNRFPSVKALGITTTTFRMPSREAGGCTFISSSHHGDGGGRRIALLEQHRRAGGHEEIHSRAEPD